MTWQEKSGQPLMTGFPALEMTEEFIKVVKEHKIGNVILFRENIRDNEQLKKLCGEIQALIRAETGHSAFIAIDQEGGIVTRDTLARIGEGSEPEAVLPLSKLGDLMGGTVGGVSIVYSPNITVMPGASAADVKAATAESFEQFKAYMDRYLRERKRLQFA
jgi:hypothetical protein